MEIPAQVSLEQIDPQFRAYLEAIPPKNKGEVQSEIDLLWEAEQATDDSPLFDGRIFSCHYYDQGLLLCHLIPYRDLFASRVSPTVGRALDILPVGVSGLVISAEGVLVGRRSSDVTDYPGHLELAPSGSVGDESLDNGEIDFRLQIMTELYEETRIEPHMVEELVPFILVRDHSTSVLDICCKIVVNEEAVAKSSQEYPELSWLPFSRVPEIFSSTTDPFVPTSQAIAKVAKDLGWFS